MLDELCSVDEAWTEALSAPHHHRLTRYLKEVPWIRDSDPSPASIPSMMWQIYKGTRNWLSLVFVDRQSVADGTAIVLQGNKKCPKTARVRMDKAILALAVGLETPLSRSLPDFHNFRIDLERSPENNPEVSEPCKISHAHHLKFCSDTGPYRIAH